MNGPTIGHGIKQEKSDLWLQALAPNLTPGEAVHALVKAAPLMSLSDLTAVTTFRVLLASSSEHCAVKKAVALADIAAVENDKNRVTCTLRDGGSFKVIASSMRRANEDATLLAETIQRCLSAPADPLAQAEFSDARQAQQAQADQVARAKKGMWSGTIVVGSRIRSKAAQTIMAHAAPGETPWLVIGSLGAGALAAFDDRLLLVKTGGVTGIMAGALGGARVTIFNFRDITGIEFNAGMVNGVLEILTPSYSGTANRDFWRGTFASRNADANDPFTLSNTLPLTKAEYAQALPHLNELRRRITKACDGQAAAPPPPASAPDLAEQIANLAALHANGALTDEEFAAAKARLLS